jgi:hypothetical protein
MWFRDSSVDIATPYRTGGPRIEPVEAIFSAPFKTGPVAHPTSNVPFGSRGTAVERWRLLTPLSITEVNESVDLFSCFLFGFSWPVIG